MNNPLVSIIILNWNGLRDSLECLDSVFRSDYPNFHVILVDNGSTDGSATSIRAKYSKITLIENKENLGFTGGNNKAIAYAEGLGVDYVWLLNNDTIVEPDTLRRLVSTAESNSDIGLVSPVIYYYDEPDKIQFCGSYIDFKNYGIMHSENINSFHEMSTPHIVSLWGTALLIKRKILKEVGYLNSKYFAYHEDCEYCTRVARSGYASVLEPKAKIYHKDSRSTGDRRAPMQVFLRTRNIYFFWMCNLKGLDKLNYARKFLANLISYSALLKGQKLNDSAEAGLDGAWAGFRDIGGAWDKNIRMPMLLKKIFNILSSWHPHFWASLLSGEFSKIISEVLKRTGINKNRKN